MALVTYQADNKLHLCPYHCAHVCAIHTFVVNCAVRSSTECVSVLALMGIPMGIMVNYQRVLIR